MRLIERFQTDTVLIKVEYPLPDGYELVDKNAVAITVAVGFPANFKNEQNQRFTSERNGRDGEI